VFSRSWAAGVAGLLIILATGCAHQAAAAPKQFSAQCPVLTAPPYGIAAKGIEATNTEDPAEKKILDQVVPGAVFKEVTCLYTAPGRTSPRIAANVKVFTGSGGAKQATSFLESRKLSLFQLATGANHADVPGVADGAFAAHVVSDYYLEARSGDAYVSVLAVPGLRISQGFDPARPLQQQLPALKTVLTDVLGGLK
jgi:hypothetical protein